MNPRRFPPTLRALLAALSLLLLLGIGGLVVCLEVRSPKPRWYWDRLGEERLARLHMFFDRVCAALLPGDRDGDGVCDGREWFRKTDLNDPKQHAYLWSALTNDGIDVIPSRGPIGFPQDRVWVGVRQRFRTSSQIMIDGTLFTSLSPSDVYPILGQRTRWRGYIGVTDVSPTVIPRGFQVRILQDKGVKLGLPNGPLAAEPLIVAVPADGRLEFDFEAAPLFGDEQGYRIEIYSAAAMDGIDIISVRRRRPDAPLTPEVEIVAADANDRDPEWRHYVLKFPSNPPWKGPCIVEAARPEAGAEWFVVTYQTAYMERLNVAQRLRNPEAKPYKGLLRFQLVPVTE